MAKKAVNRKKVLRKQLADQKRLIRRLEREAAPSLVQEAVEQAEDMVAAVSSSVNSLEGFVTLAALEGIPAARLETFYQEGIRSLEDFAAWTEKELLALKGIGPATIKQLKESGIVLKD